MPSFKDDSILIIAPGSRTTLAQLGLPESFTPARSRFRSRMFPGQQAGEWEPHKVRRKHKSDTNGHVDGNDATEEDEYEEDRSSDEGAVWPIEAGRIVNWSCFFALMEHVHRQIGPGLHTPILLIAQPVWTSREHERMTSFFFEKFKCPGFAIVDSAVATCYAYGVETATVVDVGAEKADITTIRDCVPNSIGRNSSVRGCGGDAMTDRLLELLKSRGYSRAMCEQLKMSPICEILPTGTPFPGTRPVTNGDATTTNPLTAASTGADGPGPNARHTAGSNGTAPRGPGRGTEVGGDATPEDDEGVLDVASIVTGGKMNEYLAKKEREKAEKLAAKKKGSTAADNAPKPVRLKNSEREKATFYYEDHALHDVLKGSNQSAEHISEQTLALDEGRNEKILQSATSTTAPPLEATSPTTPSTRTQQAPRRELTVGTERFQPASPAFLSTLTSSIYHTIQSHPDPTARPDLWSNIILLGNGSRIRGLKESILETLNQRYLIHPSSATMFTSELPSTFSTPLATGANTPVPHAHDQGPSHPMHGLHSSGGVNPLLHAATTAAASGAGQAPPGLHPQHSAPGLPPHLQQQQQHHPNLAPNHMQMPQQQTPQQLHPQQHLPQHLQQQQHQQQQRTTYHAQTPSSIKIAKLPDYFLEWKEIGHEEAAFLGAQVAARCLFVVGGGEKGFLTRADYNETGPSGIHEVVLGVGG